MGGCCSSKDHGLDNGLSENKQYPANVRKYGLLSCSLMFDAINVLVVSSGIFNGASWLVLYTRTPWAGPETEPGHRRGNDPPSRISFESYTHLVFISAGSSHSTAIGSSWPIYATPPLCFLSPHSMPLLTLLRTTHRRLRISPEIRNRCFSWSVMATGAMGTTSLSAYSILFPSLPFFPCLESSHLHLHLRAQNVGTDRGSTLAGTHHCQSSTSLRKISACRLELLPCITAALAPHHHPHVSPL